MIELILLGIIFVIVWEILFIKERVNNPSGNWLEDKFLAFAMVFFFSAIILPATVMLIFIWQLLKPIPLESLCWTLGTILAIIGFFAINYLISKHIELKQKEERKKRRKKK